MLEQETKIPIEGSPGVSRRRQLVRLLAMASAPALSGVRRAFAQQCPSRPIRLIVPFSTGGSMGLPKTGRHPLFWALKNAIIDRAMSAELTEYLGYGPGQAKPDGQRDRRNGTSPKYVLTDVGPVRIEVRRDREGRFEPQIIGMHGRRFAGFAQKAAEASSGSRVCVCR